MGRSKTDLGSSKAYPDSQDLGGGYFSNDPKENPMMWNWTKVFLRYCDGGSFSGMNMTVETYKDTSLYWRGGYVREAIEKDLFQNQGLSKVSDLVVSGCSAGGLATYLHTDQWCDALHEQSEDSKCVGLPDSGFFLDYQDRRCLLFFRSLSLSQVHYALILPHLQRLWSAHPLHLLKVCSELRLTEIIIAV